MNNYKCDNTDCNHLFTDDTPNYCPKCFMDSFSIISKKSSLIVLFFNDKILLKNILFAFLTLFLFCFLTLKFLDLYTLHNKFIKVPDFSKFHVSKLDSIAKENNLRFVIIDSIADPNKMKGIVVSQDPFPLTDVKKNRRIYLTITESETRIVNFPDIYDLTLRQALRKLDNSGLLIGKLEYKSDIAINKILDFNVNGIKLVIGQEILKGTIVNLVLGKGLSQEDVLVPNLIGLDRIAANIIIKLTSLNIGEEIYLPECLDSSNAIIYKQIPAFENDNKLKLGSRIDLFYDKPSTNNNN